MPTVQRRALLCCALSLLVLAMAVAPGAAPAIRTRPAPGPPTLVFKDRMAKRRLQWDRKAFDVLGRVMLRSIKKYASCRPKPGPPEPSTATGSPSAQLVDQLAPLRRALAPGDAVEKDVLAFLGPVYRDFTRTVVTPGGHRFVLVVTHSTPGGFDLPDACLAAIKREATRATADSSKPVRRRVLGAVFALRVIRDFPDQEEDEVSLLEPAPRRLVGSASEARFSLDGISGWGGGPTRGWVAGLVPDGVAAVALRYPRRHDQGRYYKPTVYPAAATVTAPVRDNVFRAIVPRPGRDARPAWMGWLGPDGRLLRRVTPGLDLSTPYG